MLLRHYSLNEDEQKLVNMSVGEFDSYMMENYADMFRNRNVKEGQEVIYPMNFGFSIGPGWRHVLDSLCRKLKFIQELTGLICVFDQIKEKYGSARFYYHVEASEDGAQDNKDLADIVDDLVHLYEEYTDYVCEELGTNIDPDEKVQMGSWMYGMGIEGFEKCERKHNSEYSDKRIEMAKRGLESAKKRKEIKKSMYYFDMSELEELEKVVNEISKKRKAKNELV